MVSSKRARLSVLFAFAPAIAMSMLVLSADRLCLAAKPAPSLDLVPADAAFYSATLNLGEQWKAVSQSHAWAKLKALPVVQMGLGLYAITSADPDSPAGKFAEALRDPEKRKPMDLAADMVSEEVFMYGTPSVTNFIVVAQEVMSATRYTSLTEAVAQGKGKAPDPNLQQKAILAAMAKNADRFAVPEGIVGFKVKNVALAKEQLARLEEMATAALDEQPQLKGRLKSVSVEGHSYLTLSLDGEMIPWKQDEIDDLKKYELHDGDVDKLVARAKKLTLVLAIGLRDDYLLVSIGPSTDILTRLGKGESLRTRAELAPLEKFSDKRMTGVAYISKAMMARLGTSKKDVDNVLNAFETVLPSLEIPDDARDDLRKDAGELASDASKLIPKAGSLLEFSFLVDGGAEGYLYDSGEHGEIDGSKPLTLLRHVGGSPLIAAVDRSKVSIEGYDLLSKWAAVAFWYFEKYGKPHIPADGVKQYDKFAEKALPLIHRLDETNRTMLLPALADGQSGIVLDAKLMSKRFLKNLPATENAMPMAEPAIIFGVKDADLLRKAFSEYYSIAQGFIEASREFDDNKIPAGFQIPGPKVIKVKNGTVYSYPLPKELGVDPKVLPNAGLSDHVAVLTVTRAHSERLLASTTPKVGSRELPTDRPLACVAAIDFVAIIDAITPWIDLAIDRSMKGEDGNTANADNVREQTHTVLSVLKVFHGSETEVYMEGGVLVSHSRTEIRDLAE